MTVSTTDNKEVYTADGIEVMYSYDFRMDYDDDMKVYLNEVLVSASEYTIAKAGDNIGGTVTFNIAPALDTTITLLRSLDMTQETDYIAGDPFPAEAHEDALDKQTMLIQQVQEQVDRNTQAIGGEEGVDTQAPEFQANKAWKWDDGTNKKLINSTYDPDEQASLAAGYATDASNSAASASGSASSALASEDKAYQWAEEAEDVPVEAGEYSAHHWAIKAAGNAAGVSSVNGQSGVIVLDKTWVGLDNVDDTSDADKPISDATQLALDDKTDVAQVTTIAEESAVAMAIALG